MGIKIEKFDPKAAESRQVSSHIYLNEGTYHWIYELNMLKNPTLLITVTKVLTISVLIEFVLLYTLIMLADGFILEDFLGMLEVHLALWGVFLVLGVVAYFILSCLYGFKYVVIFQMNEQQIKHIQAPHQFKKAQVLGALCAVLGIRTLNPGTAGLGLIVSASQVKISEFAKVRQVKVSKRRHVIKLREFFSYNQIYFDSDDDFELVYSFIKEHCVNAKFLE